MKYDLIGDIHGHSKSLIELLTKLDYKLVDCVYRHVNRQAIFLGDFIDRGPDQRGVIDIVHLMLDRGSALSVMGNHEFNAIAWFTPDPDNPGKYLREHSVKHRKQHQIFLDAYEGSHDYEELIDWFTKLPTWLELPGLRVVHACWEDSQIRYLSESNASKPGYLSRKLLLNGSRKGLREFEAIETLLKGKEIMLPNEQSFHDKDGNPRQHIRIRWWDACARTYRDAFLGPDSAVSHIPEESIDVDNLFAYTSDKPPVFIGHYWMEGNPALLAPNVACLDYSVGAQTNGKLVAYRWDGEQELDESKFVWQSRAAVNA